MKWPVQPRSSGILIRTCQPWIIRNYYTLHTRRRRGHKNSIHMLRATLIFRSNVLSLALASLMCCEKLLFRPSRCLSHRAPSKLINFMKMSTKRTIEITATRALEVICFHVLEGIRLAGELNYEVCRGKNFSRRSNPFLPINVKLLLKLFSRHFSINWIEHCQIPIKSWRSWRELSPFESRIKRRASPYGIELQFLCLCRLLPRHSPSQKNSRKNSSEYQAKTYAITFTPPCHAMEM